MPMNKQTFIQMSGAPGSGKTTIAHAVAKTIGAVVIDHDITKSALLAVNIPVALVGRASYQVLNALAGHLLQQGHSVIFDSPCFYTELLHRGQTLAADYDADYRYIECVLQDLDELDRRLQTRVRQPSQVAGVYTPPTPGSGKTQNGTALFRDWIANMKRPADDYLTLDTAQPLEQCVAQALRYLRGPQG